MEESNYQIPNKMPTYIRRLELMYKTENKVLYDILGIGSIFIEEAVEYDNWNGGTTGHKITFFLPEDTFERIGNFENQNELQNQLQSDLNKCSHSIENEFITTVHFELNDELDPNFQKSINPFKQSIINPDSVDIWEPGFIRLFISHHDEYKKQANEIAEVLKGYGVSAFVAHDTIKPMEEWQQTIRKGLQTMEIMLAFITDNFFDSNWTNQEIGVAIGRGIPIISLKLQSTAPQGFISGTQALKGDISNAAASYSGIYDLLCEKLGQEERIRKATIKAFATSENYVEAQERFKTLQKLKTFTDNDSQTIISAFSENENLRGAYYLTNQYNRLCNFLENRTGKHYKVEGKCIVMREEEFDDKVPF